MHLLITMAGLYTRFSPFSYQVPKYLLPLSNRTVLHHVLATLLRGDLFSGLLLVANERDIAFKPQIVSTIQEFGFSDKDLLFIGDTEGQAETAFIGAQEILRSRDDLAVAVHNIDTILLHRDMKIFQEKLSVASCAIDVFYANNKEYSYVQINDSGDVTGIREKVVISKIASSGFYCFESMGLMSRYLQEAIDNGEHYISNGIRRMIHQEHRVVIGPIYTENNTVVVGTPEEYLEAAAVFGLYSQLDS